MNKFEVVLVSSPELPTKTLEDFLNKFKKSITDNSGKIINQEDWGLRDLSYSIKKFNKAFYHYIQIEMSSNILDGLKKELNQTDTLLRYIFIKVKTHQNLPTKLNHEKA
tara:strand:+ start:282 stop:608 length:327 start_codon:yes stop_codon:yes gene_type:complete